MNAKRSLLLAGFFLVLLSATGAALPIAISGDGALRAGDLQFRIVHHDPGWKNARTFRDDGSGKFPVYRGMFTVRQRLQSTGDGAMALQCELTSGSAVESAYLAYEASLPSGTQLWIDGTRVNFGKKLDRAHWQKTFDRVRKLVVESPSGSITIRGGERSILLVDERMFGRSTIGIRLPLAPARGKLKKAQWTGTISFAPVRSVALNLAPIATMGFVDEVAGDGKGGWTDQGPLNDLGSIPVGKNISIEGVPFPVIDPAVNGGKGCVAFRSPTLPNLPLRRQLVFRASELPRGKYLYLLHAVAWPPKTGEIVGEIACGMASGIAVEKQTRSFPVVQGREVGNFWMPEVLPRAMVGWKGRNRSAPVGLYLTRFELTGEAVRDITFTSRAVCNWMIVSAVLSDRRIDGKAAAPVTIRAGREYMPIHNKSEVLPGSALDFSHLATDAPAGKYGRVIVSGDHFEFENKRGTPCRFYGTNIVYWSHFLSKDDADKLARQLAAAGYNMLRLHMFDLPQLCRTDKSGAVRLTEDAFD
ncbi:MAG: hypothetical protein PHS41_12425, partial [Victivallaceae bacterium]|nr:hypothetical protein [Victivallaceae bacterium]